MPSLTCFGVNEDNIVLAVLAPMPLTEINSLKISRSATDENPYNVCESSRTNKYEYNFIFLIRNLRIGM